MRSIPALIVLAALIGLAAPSGGTARAETATIDTGDNYFCSTAFQNGNCTTTVAAGDTVVWSVSQGIHTITQCDETHSSCPLPGGFDSDIVQAGNSYSQTFNTPGTFSYYCELHPTDMTGTIVVQAITPTPTPAPNSGGIASQTATPASVPQTGGEPAAASGVSSVVMLAIGGLLAAAGAGSAFAARRG